MDQLSFDAVVCRQPDRPPQVERLTARFGEPGDVLVKVLATSVCHTDFEAATGRMGALHPFVPGHEAAGVVEAVTDGVTGVRPGDRVVLSWNPNCGHCFYCARRVPILCEPYVAGFARGRLLDGGTRLSSAQGPVNHLMFTASFAQYCVVSERSAIAVPADMPVDRACLLGCAVATGFLAAERTAAVTADDTVLVIGCGAVGLSAIQGARLSGARRILAADLDDRKLAMAVRMGAEVAINAAREDLVESVRRETAGRGADCVIECAGNEKALQASVEAARPGGRIVWLGKLPANDIARFRWGSLMGEKRIVRSSYGGARPAEDFPRLARLYLDGALLLDPLVEEVGGLQDAARYLDAVGAGTALRNVVKPWVASVEGA